MPVNLVFQGGGVRGIAYAGALETCPGNTRIEGVAGTSAAPSLPLYSQSVRRPR